MKYLIGIITLVFLASCSISQPEVHLGKKHLGLYIDNGERQGFQYFDAAGTEYNYRYITAEIYNDSIIPVALTFGLTNNYYHPCTTDSVRIMVFLLPRQLTPEKIQKDKSMSVQLKQFLDTGTVAPSSYYKLLKPKEICVVTFGTLTPTKYFDPFQIGLISKGHDYLYYFYAHDSIIKQVAAAQNPFTLSLGLDFSDVPHTTNANCYLVLPCGQISYTEK